MIFFDFRDFSLYLSFFVLDLKTRPAFEKRGADNICIKLFRFESLHFTKA